MTSTAVFLWPQPETVPLTVEKIVVHSLSETERQMLRDNQTSDAGEAGNDVEQTENHRSHNWPRLFGEDFSSVSRERGLQLPWDEKEPKEKWRIPVGTGYSSPIALDGAAYLFHRVANEGIISCFDIETGQTLWEFKYPASYHCPTHYSSGPYSTPVIDGDLLFAVAAEAKLFCLRRKTGESVWERNLAEDFELQPKLLGFGPGIGLDEHRLYLNVGGVAQAAGVVAFDKQSGETLWKSTDHSASFSTPRVAKIHDKDYLFVFTEQGLVSLDPATGEEHWVHPFHSRVPDTINAVTPAILGDLVMVTCGPGPGAVCLQIQPDGSKQVQWQERRVLDSMFNNLLLHDRHVYGFTCARQGEPTFRCVDMATGKLRWRHESDLGRGQSLGVDGHLIVLGEYGHLAVLKLSPQELIPLAMTEQPLLPAPCYSAPAIHRGILLLRNEGTLLALSLRKELAE